MLDFESGDYRAFLGPWYDFFLERGRWRGLGEMTEQVSSYLPYLFEEEPIPRWLLALVMLGALALVVRRLLQLEGRPMRRGGTE